MINVHFTLFFYSSPSKFDPILCVQHYSKLHHVEVTVSASLETDSTKKNTNQENAATEVNKHKQVIVPLCGRQPGAKGFRFLFCPSIRPSHSCDHISRTPWWNLYKHSLELTYELNITLRHKHWPGLKDDLIRIRTSKDLQGSNSSFYNMWPSWSKKGTWLFNQMQVYTTGLKCRCQCWPWTQRLQLVDDL